MKIIDLLNKIANGEEVPEIIKYNNFIYKYNKDICDYDGDDLYLFGNTDKLNEEVEIIEEDKKIEKIKDILHIDDLIPPVDENMYKIWQQTIKNHNKINEIIDYLMENKQ